MMRKLQGLFLVMGLPRRVWDSLCLSISHREPRSRTLKHIYALVFGAFLFLSSVSAAKEIDLVIPTFHPTWMYYHDLVKRSLEVDGYQVNFQYLDPDTNHKRIMLMLESGEGGPLFLWRSRNPKRDRVLVPIRVDIGERMLGMRVLFIRKGTQSEFDNVKTLADFRQLQKKGAFGAGWSDINVWKHNNLSTMVVDGDWKNIYQMLEIGNREVDYFSRGIFEIFIEHKQYPMLDIEKNLLFAYDKALTLYFSKSYAYLQPILESSLKRAQKSGLMKEIMQVHFPEVFSEITKRRVINLQIPPPN